MLTRRGALVSAILCTYLVFAPGAGAAVRVSTEGGAPFSLLESAAESTTVWYDAETWLRHFPGSLEWQADQKRLTYREGAHQGMLLGDPPYALRDGIPLDRAPPTRLISGRLAVSETFLLERAGDFLGRLVSVQRAHGTGSLRVMIDPGHGGADAGARGGGNVAEKDVVLALGRELIARLKRRGFDAGLTRQDDRSFDAASRAAASNHWEADLFLSLHAAGAARPRVRGFEIFVSRPPAPGFDPRLWAGGQIARVAESRKWAELIRTLLGESLSTFDRGVKELSSPLLEAVTSPACLAELGNLDVPEEAEFLLKPQGRSALAETLAGAVEAFFRLPP